MALWNKAAASVDYAKRRLVVVLYLYFWKKVQDKISR